MAEPFLKAPKNWSRCTLEPDIKIGAILQVETGGTPNTSVEEYWDGEIPWLTPKEITAFVDGIYISKTERAITRSGLLESSAKQMPPGTVMLTKRAPVGSVAVNAVPMATNQGFLNFLCGPRLRPLYLAYWFRANRPYLEAVANGSTYPELYKGDLFEFEIAFPSISEQDSIVRLINSFQYIALLGLPLEQSTLSLEDMTKIQEQTRRLTIIRDALLPKLLSGEIRV